MEVYNLKSLNKKIVSIVKTVQTEFLNEELELLNFKENGDSWSILECIEHLNRYHVYYNKQMFKALTKANSAPKNGVVKFSWIGKTSVEKISVKNEGKMRTLKRMDPKNSELDHQVLKDFINYNRELLSIIEQSNGLDVNQKLIRIEFLKILKLSLVETIAFMMEHENRHILQAKRAHLLAKNNS